ncbi:MAG: VWA domain-containing protein [Planctomycetota bacterium]|nr:VWA domain-containing protein [Planctomycetota bacterium]
MTEIHSTTRQQKLLRTNAVIHPLMKSLAALLLLLVAFYPQITDADTEGSRRPLDLPSGGGGYDEDSDDPLPDTVLFFGQSFDGDAFFWVLDVSGSMAFDGRIDTLKSEFLGAVNSLSSQSDFGAIAFSSNMIPFDMRCGKASPARKVAAAGWIAQVQPHGGTCLAIAVIEGLSTLRQSSHEHRRLILVGDGKPECGGLADAEIAHWNILAANWDRIPIDTVFTGGQEAGLHFFQRLSNANQGRLTISQ